MSEKECLVQKKKSNVDFSVGRYIDDSENRCQLLTARKSAKTAVPSSLNHNTLYGIKYKPRHTLLCYSYLNGFLMTFYYIIRQNTTKSKAACGRVQVDTVPYGKNIWFS